MPEDYRPFPFTIYIVCRHTGFGENYEPLKAFTTEAKAQEWRKSQPAARRVEFPANWTQELFYEIAKCELIA